ncbi:MAG: transglutaminase [Moraxellaceae bacterium]|jgi:transglutaminase-like putative cysteine protease|nr:transglutaminase [Moraxellaceae bacterium]
MSAPMMSRSARNWQWLALLGAVAPQYDRLPLWLSVAVVLACLWRLEAVERRLGMPPLWLRVLLLLAGTAGVVFSHRTLLGPEGGVSFLIVSALLKMLESRTSRDVFVAAVLDFFLLATAFLFSQSLAQTLYVAVASIPVVASLLSLQQREGVGVGRTLRRAGALVGQAFPLMLILFLFFPRLPPLWTLNLTQGTARTGMSDSMSPGDISSLSESSETAFRVEFEGTPPPADSLYWRGLVFGFFDGQRWSQGYPMTEQVPLPPAGLPDWVTGVEEGEAPLRYRIILEPTDQPWLFGLAISRSSTERVGLTRDQRLVYRDPVLKRFTYDVESWPQAQADVDALPEWMRRQSLQLPADGNPEARRMALRWRNSTDNPGRVVQEVLDWFRDERFFYSLQAPPLGENRVDDFLFRTRSGFCEHYASSFVFLMRAAGIPARVVAGYQGGELSQLGDYWLVRQLDAHAWAEVWLPGQGWVRVDPTAAVAPQRIEAGAAQAAEQRAYWGDTAAGAIRHNNYRMLRQLRNAADYLNYRWHRDVVGYDNDRQNGLMERLLGSSDLMRRLLVMGGGFALVAGVLLFFALRGRHREQHPLDRLYRRYCARLARRGIAREAGEGPQAFARRVAATRPALAAEAAEFARLYTALRYRPAGTHEAALLRRLRRIARGRPGERLFSERS